MLQAHWHKVLWKRNKQPFPLVFILVTTLLAAVGRSAASPWTEGAKTVLFMRVDFSDKVGEPISEAAALTMMNTNVNTYYQDSSFGKTSLSATITPRANA